MKLINVICLLIGINLIGVLNMDANSVAQFFMVVSLVSALVLILTSKYIRGKTTTLYTDHPGVAGLKKIKASSTADNYLLAGTVCVFICLAIQGYA